MSTATESKPHRLAAMNFRGSLNYYSGWLAGFFAGISTPLLVIVWWLIGLPFAGALAAGLLTGAGIFVLLVPRIPQEWVDVILAQRRWVRALWTTTCGIVILVIADLSVFMANPGKKQFSLTPQIPFMVKLNNLTAYLSAAQLARHDPSHIYTVARYASPAPDHVLLGVAPLNRDTYAYPPTTLLLPRTMLAFSRNFVELRAAWYVFSAAVVVVTMVVVARWVGGRMGAVLAVLTPVVWVSLPMLISLQLQNVHVPIAYDATLIAMILFELQRRAGRGVVRDVGGGALLGFSIVVKLFPGVFVLYLLIQKRWAPAIWTAAFSAGYTALTYLLYGAGPFRAFFGHGTWLKIQNGSWHAYIIGWMPATLDDYSPFGIPYKLKLAGLGFSDPVPAARLLADVYSALVLALVVVVAWRMRQVRADGPETRMRMLLVWLSVLSLVSFTAAFGPWTYGAVGAVWLLAAYASYMKPTTRNVVAVAACWSIVSAYGPNVPVPMVVFTLTAQAIIYATGFLFALRASSALSGSPAGTDAMPAPGTSIA